MKTYRVVIQHVTEGHIITRPMTQVPRKGDHVFLIPDTYVVTSVAWDLGDATTVILTVDHFSN
jgi:hypothetical protein